MSEKTYYACGANYVYNTSVNTAYKEFRLVKPTGRGSVPYVCETQAMGRKLYHHCKHHSHLYMIVDRDGDITAHLVQDSWECDAEAPLTPQIPERERELLQRVIETKKFWAI